MYDSREKARLDREWQLSLSFLAGKMEGKTKGKIELIRTLQAILHVPPSPDAELQLLTYPRRSRDDPDCDARKD